MSASPSLNRHDITKYLHQHEDELSDRYGVASLALFGSAARDELSEGNDIDVVVRFSTRTTFDAYFDLKFFWKIYLAVKSTSRPNRC